MRIKNWVGVSTLASAAFLLAACGGFDPGDMESTVESELGGFQSATPGDLSQGAACVESIRPAGLECPGLSPIEQRALAAQVAPRLMSITPTLRVTIIKSGDAVLAQLDGGGRGQGFENLFGTQSLTVPVQSDGSFEVTVPVAEQGASLGSGLGAMGAGPGFGMGPGAGMGAGLGIGPGVSGGLGGFGGALSPIGTRSMMGPVGGGPGFLGGQAIGGECGCPTGLQGQGQFGPSATLSGPIGAQQGVGPEACGACGPQLPGFGMASPGFGTAMMPTQNAYAVEAHLRGQVDLANLQYARDEVNKTETAILDQNQNLQMQGEIVLIPLTGGGFEQGAGGPQAFPGGQQAVPITPRGVLSSGAAGQQGQFGPSAQQVQQAPQGHPGHLGHQHPTSGPNVAGPGWGAGEEVGAACRIPLQICGSCGVSVEGPQPAIVTSPVVPEIPTCVPMIIRPTMASPCCGAGAPAISPMSLGAPCGTGCQ